MKYKTNKQTKNEKEEQSEWSFMEIEHSFYVLENRVFFMFLLRIVWFW